MNGQSAPGLDGFGFLDDRWTSGERVTIGKLPEWIGWKFGRKCDRIRVQVFIVGVVRIRGL